MRVLVCGGRAFDQLKFVGRALAEIHADRPISLLISGGAPGADRCGESWAQHNRVGLCVFPANWNFEGKAAGPLRNARMLEFGKPDLVVGFPGGFGTQDMLRKARAAGIEVRLFAPAPARTA